MNTPKKTIILFAVLIISNVFSQNTVRLYGKVTDFNNNPVDSASVWLKNKINGISIKDKRKLFDNAYETFTDKDGNFSIEVEKGTYYCLYAIKESDYGKTKLEYWAWNLPLYDDLEINPKYDRLEVYGMNAFEPQTGPFETYQVFFRPMSLTKALKLPKKITSEIIDIAPKVIAKEDLKVQINGVDVKILSLNRVQEYSRKKYMYGYFLQILKPKAGEIAIPASEMVKGHDKISITLHAKETNEKGKGEYFIKKIGN